MAPRPSPAGSRPGLSPTGRLVIVFVLLLAACATASPASAITVRDVIELSQAGIADDVLIELVELEPPGGRITPADLLALKEAGVSDQVVVAILRAARTEQERRARAEAGEAAQARERQAAAAACAEAMPASQALIVGERRSRVRVEQVAVPVPVPVVVQQVVQVGSPSWVGVAARGHGQIASRDGGPGLPDGPGRTGVSDRQNGSAKRAHWIVNSAGWIIK